MFTNGNLILGIATPISLIAFFISIYFGFKLRRSNLDLKKLKEVPENERADVLKSLETDYPSLIELNSLSKDQRYSLALKQIKNKERGRQRTFYLTIVIACLSFVTIIIFKSSNDDTKDKLIDEALLAGRDININNFENRKNDGELEITKVGWTHDAEYDVILRNLGDVDLVIHKIEIQKLSQPKGFVLPILQPSATYIFEVDKIDSGQSKSIDVAHVVFANKADRILIATETTTMYSLKVIFYYNKDKSISFIQDTWGRL